MNFKKLIYVLSVSVLFTSCASNSNKYDERAIASMDALSETIGKMNSCSYTLNTFVVEGADSQFSNVNDVYMRGPDKMYVHTVGTRGQRGFWFDGEQMSYFKFDENTFDTMAVSGNIMDAIDYIHNKYGVDFPASDFFYPTFTDDMMENFDEILYYGDTTIFDKEMIAIEALNDKVVAQIWIEKSTNLPYELIISSKSGSTFYYEAIFSNWRVDPNLPDMLFEFYPPENATRVALKSKN